MSDREANAGEAEAPPLPVIDGYRIETSIGRGGMATVYLARQLSLDRPVAIKVMAAEASDHPAQAARFEHEARIIARLEHPGIVGIHEVGRLADGRLYYVMPHLPKGDLAQRDLRTDELAIAGVLRVLLQALGHAHAHGVVHRDVKPENVLFDAAGNPRLADFGIAIGARRATPRITREGMALGSSGYMAPEQARGETTDGRSDLYSVGVLAYEMLTGRLPFEAEDELTLALMHAQDEAPRLPPDRRHWQALLDRAMAKWPEQRYRDAEAMLRGLERVEHAIRQSQRRPLGRLLHTLDVPGARRWALPLLILFALLAAGAWLAVPTAPVATADPVIEVRDPMEERLREAAAQLDSGALVVPAGANAAESYLNILREQPGRADAMNGLRRVFAALAEQARAGVQAGDGDLLRERLQQAELLAEGLGALGEEGRQTVRMAALQALDAEVAQAVAAGDAERTERALARYAENGLDATAARALLARMTPQRPAPAESVAAPTAGPAARGRVAAQPVSVAEYRRFAEATRRAPARCRVRLSPLQFVDDRSWRDPGFPQTDASPVVCVSLADAEAYARWLSERSGSRWRLPSLAERRAAGLSSPVAEWTSDCASGPGRSCSRRVTFAAPGSDRRGEASEQPREADRGFDSVGFRLIAGQ